jgi:hypothetical protein
VKARLVGVKCGPEYNGSGADKVRALPIDVGAQAGRALYVDVWLDDGYPFGSANVDGETVVLGGICLSYAVESDGPESITPREAWMGAYDEVELLGFPIAMMRWDS